MEESTRLIIAYAALIIGMPLLFARIFWFIPGIILAKVLSHVIQGIDEILNAAVEGFIAIFLACVVFDRLNLHIPLGVPIILIIINSLLDWAKESTYKRWASAVGIIVGFHLHHHVLHLLADGFGLNVL